MPITAKFQKIEFDKYTTSGVSMTTIYLMQFIMDKIAITAAKNRQLGEDLLVTTK